MGKRIFHFRAHHYPLTWYFACPHATKQVSKNVDYCHVSHMAFCPSLNHSFAILCFSCSVKHHIPVVLCIHFFPQMLVHFLLVCKMISFPNKSPKTKTPALLNTTPKKILLVPIVLFFNVAWTLYISPYH